MRRPAEPLFLERQSYRRRRLADAARLLPLVGLVLVLMPVLWSDTARTALGLVYVFTIWGLLIALVAPVSARLAKFEPETGDDGAPPERQGQKES